YIGWLMHGPIGGVMAGVLFVLPGVAAIMALSVLYALFGGIDAVDGLLFGLQAAVVAVVIEAVLRIGRRTLRTSAHLALAAAAFVAIFFLQVPFPLIVVGAGLIGFVGGRARPALFRSAGLHATGDATRGIVIADDGAGMTRATSGAALRSSGVALVLWLVPVAVVAAVLGSASVFTQEAVFFSKSAVVTFGGAYAVLAYIAQAAVDSYGWLRPGEMLTGLGLAETTPGPLIMVVQFVGFMAAFRNPGPLAPLTAGVLGSLLVTWVTFVPCFFFIFAGAPFIERLRGHRGLTATLSAITAAVVGVVLNLAVWFALHTVFGQVHVSRLLGLRLLRPDPSSVDVAAVLLAAFATVAIFRLKWSVTRTLGVSAALGLVVALTTRVGT
ncbi:MAG: chromate transporter, partial [Actinomycetota bacterium]|nr:chromate transporter [Actinomycetota bacterium]